MRLAPLVAVLALGPGLAAAADERAQPEDAVELHAGAQVLRISLASGLPSAWLSCAAGCDDPAVRRQAFFGEEDGGMRWTSDDPARREAMAGLRYEAVLGESGDAVTAVLTATGPAGEHFVQRYVASRTEHTVRMELMALADVGVALVAARDLAPPPLPGFGAAFGGVRAVRVTGDGQRELEPSPGGSGELAAERDAWLGLRARFWAWLARAAGDVVTTVRPSASGNPEMSWRAAPGAPLVLTVYAGPVEWKSLRVVSPDLTQMLFAALWEPLRWLCYGLLFLLALIGRVVHEAGVAIILLSLAVKILLWPLTDIADRWQQDVNRIQARLQPRIHEIRRQFRGEEAHERTLQAYREEGVHPLFTLKSLAGFAIQLPMFIAAFDMLADNFALSGTRFLWIADLSAPDRFVRLPFTLPLLGAHLNLLPVLMSALTLLAAFVQRDASLTPELARRQRWQLYAMAGGFFLLFYTFPAGMVLYWTANNFWHLVKLGAAGLVARRA